MSKTFVPMLLLALCATPMMPDFAMAALDPVSAATNGSAAEAAGAEAAGAEAAGAEAPAAETPEAETPEAKTPSSDTEDPGFVVICPINGMIDDGIAVVVERAVRENPGAKAIIFSIDTPGGLVDSCLNIVATILSAPYPTIAYVNTDTEGMGAISAGAIISFACKDIIMSSTANMGDAAPVTPTQEGMMPLGEKEVSFLRSKMQSLAEHNGHNPAIARAMVDKDVELWARQTGLNQWEVFEPTDADREQAKQLGFAPASSEDDSLNEVIDEATEGLPESMREAVRGVAKAVKEEMGEPTSEEPATENAAPATGVAPAETVPQQAPFEVVLAKGKLLTLTAKDAQRFGVIKTTAMNIDQVMGFYGYTGAERVEIKVTIAESIFRWLTNPMVSGILLMLGIAGIYLEMKTPGFGLPGVVGIVCLALFFGARVVLGLASWIDVALIITGLALLAVEIFVLPGFGIAGVAGIGCLLAGLYLSFMQSDIVIPEYSWQFDRLRDAGITMTITAICLPILIYLMWKLLPYTPMYGRLVLAHAQRVDEGYVVQTSAECQEAIGRRGVATSILRPAGRGRFGDKTYQVVSLGEFVPKGTPIEIVEADGNRYVVQKVPGAEAPRGEEEA